MTASEADGGLFVLFIPQQGDGDMMEPRTVFLGFRDTPAAFDAFKRAAEIDQGRADANLSQWMREVLRKSAVQKLRQGSGMERER